MALDRITTTGTYFVSGQFDEFTINPVATSVNIVTNSDTYLSNFTSSQNGMSFASGFQDPKGGTSAYRVTLTAGTFQYYMIYNTGFSNELTVSAHFKYVSQRYVEMILDNGGANGIVGNYDLVAGTATTTQNGTGVNRSVSMVPAGNGWWRCILTGTPNPGSTTARFSIIAAGSNTASWYPTNALAANQFDAWGFQVEYNNNASIYQSKSGGSRVTTPSVTSLTTSGDFLIKGEFNEVTYNPTTSASTNLVNKFVLSDMNSATNITTYWNNFLGMQFLNYGGISGLNDVTPVVKFVPDSSTNEHYIGRTYAVASTGTTWTYSAFGKAAEYNSVQLRIVNSGGANDSSINFTLSGNGTASVNSQGIIVASSQFIYPTNNGWYRFGFTYTAYLASMIHRINMRDNGGVTTFTGNGSSGTWITGAQLEAGSVASMYVPTNTTGQPIPTFAKRISNTGTVYVQNQFDEVTMANGVENVGGVQYVSSGSFVWTVPAGVTSISVIAVGAGGSGGGYGGGGGALRYANNISVTPGGTYTVIVGWPNAANTEGRGGTSSFGISVAAPGGIGGNTSGGGGSSGGSPIGTGGNGGGGGGDYFTVPVGYKSGGGGGAGGYTGNGGNGASPSWVGTPTSGAGGAGGGGGQGGPLGTLVGLAGGGVGVWGIGANGAAFGTGADKAGLPGGGGSGGDSGALASTSNGGDYGGGSGGYPGSGGKGTVRIIWPGTSRQFPSTGILAAINETTV
jgi:hypothetical protein